LYLKASARAEPQLMKLHVQWHISDIMHTSLCHFPYLPSPAHNPLQSLPNSPLCPLSLCPSRFPSVSRERLQCSLQGLGYDFWKCFESKCVIWCIPLQSDNKFACLQFPLSLLKAKRWIKVAYITTFLSACSSTVNKNTHGPWLHVSVHHIMNLRKNIQYSTCTLVFSNKALSNINMPAVQCIS